MLCEICKKRQATVRYRESINGKVTEKFICSECASANGYYDKINMFESKFINPAEFITSVFEPQKSRGAVCKNCGTTSDEVLNTGYLGCSECYKAFREIISPMIRRVQGGTQHVGKSPETSAESMSERDKLTLKLKRALEREDYEEAVKLRDMIRKLRDEEEQNG